MSVVVDLDAEEVRRGTKFLDLEDLAEFLLDPSDLGVVAGYDGDVVGKDREDDSDVVLLPDVDAGIGLDSPESPRLKGLT